MIDRFPELLQTGIDFVDVGCSGELAERWQPLKPTLNWVGFDPDSSDVQSGAENRNGFRSTRYIPYAVTDRVGDATLHITASPHCNSLLVPNHPWLKRFSFAELFREVGECTVPCATLDHLVETSSLRADVLKLDTQGLELPILGSAERLLANAICVETETGFTENYVGESLASDVDRFMRSRGFLMLDMQVYRVGRANALSNVGKHQPIWCEVVWIRDYVNSDVPLAPPTRVTALKALAICWALNFADFGLELAEHFVNRGVLRADEIQVLREAETWRLPVHRDFIDRSLLVGLRLLPGKLRRRVAGVAGDSVDQINALRSLGQKLAFWRS